MADSSITDLSNLINPQGSFEFFEGPKPPEKATKSDVFGAAWRAGATGGLFDLITRDALPAEKDLDINYNPIADVPDEFLNERDIGFFINSRSQQETAYLSDEMRRYNRDTNIIHERPWLFFGASMVTDPAAMFLPTIKGGSAVKAGYSAAIAANAAEKSLALATLKASGQTAATMGLTTGLQAVGIEAIQQQVREAKSAADSAYEVVGSAILGTVLGGLGGGAASAIGIRSANSHINNALAQIPDTPGMQPVSKVFTMGPVETVIHESNEAVAATPKWVRNSMKFSDMNQLMESPFQTSNWSANQIYSHGFTLKKNIDAGIPTSLNLEDSIFKAMNSYQSPMLEFDKIFRGQLGVTGDFASGVRARVAEAFRDKGTMNRQQFHMSVAQALDSGKSHPYEPVNQAAEILRNQITLPIKRGLVETGQLHPKFLSPEFDPYFHRMWRTPDIAKDPNGFEKLTRDFFIETDQFYRANQSKIKELSAPSETTRKEIEAVRKEISVLNEKRNGKINRPLSKADQAKFNESTKLLKELKERLLKELDPLYDFIPAKYLPHDGHIPGLKSGEELGAAAKQTLMRLLGTDIEQQTNPFSRGIGNPDPLQSRVFQIPNDFSTTVTDPDGTVRSVTAWDFIEKDIHRVFSNYVRKTVPRTESEKFAQNLGYEQFSDLRRGILESLEKDFLFAKSGKKGKAAEKITKQHKRDLDRINRAFDTLNNITNAEINAYSQDFNKLLRHMNEWTEKRLLGSAAVSSITDLGIAPFRQNFDGFILDWMIPLGERIVTLQKNKAQRINAQTAKEWGFAIQTEIGKRQKALMNNDELLIPHSWWGKVAETISGPFGNVTLQNPLNDLVSNAAFSASVSKTMRTIDRKLAGKRISKRNDNRLLAIGISEENQRIIHDMWREAVGPDGGKAGTVYYADPGKWNVNTPERAAAYLAFENATTRDFRQSKLQTTLGDRPPGTDTTAWRTILKFKDYLFAAQNKIMLPAAQKLSSRELDVFLGVTNILALGGLAYILNGIARDPSGESLDLSPGKLFHESLDRSALLGIFMEGINLFQKTGWLPIGESSRWQSRGIFGSVLGPTAGVVDDLLITGGRIMQSIYGEREFSEADIKSIMRLLPYQNLFYLRYLNEQLAQSLTVSLGAKESR